MSEPYRVVDGMLWNGDKVLSYVNTKPGVAMMMNQAYSTGYKDGTADMQWDDVFSQRVCDLLGRTMNQGFSPMDVKDLVVRLASAASRVEAMRDGLEKVAALEHAKEMRVPAIARGTGMMGQETPDGFVPLHPMAAAAFRTAAAIARAALEGKSGT